MQDYVFGYGSLMCQQSRSRTVAGQGGVAIPVLVQGLQRSWSCQIDGMTALGIFVNEQAESVGVLVPVTEEQLGQFDEREGDEYDRVLIPIDKVSTVPFLDAAQHYSEEDPDHQPFLDAKEGRGTVQIWVYVQNNPLLPTEQNPIVQSYCDTILRGCLEIHEEFAVNFLKTTDGWHSPSPSAAAASAGVDDDDVVVYYVDDRHAPIYPRGDTAWSLRQAAVLDRLIQTHRPHHYSRRKPLRRAPCC